MKRVAIAKRSAELLLLLMLSALFFAGAALAQVPVDEDGNPIPAIEDGNGNSAAPGVAGDALLSATELEELVGPVALYPDDLLAIVLPASTYPLEIVQAARFLERLEIDSTLEPDESWDESVIALLNYPEVIQMMDEDIDWTWRLGEAVIAQQSDVIAAVEAFRDRAYAAGNLKSDEYQTVTVEEGVIEIEPVEEEIIYVPYYEPAEVVVYQPRRVYYYYPDPYPVYYYPYPAGYRFRTGLFWGVTTNFHIGWSNHYLHVYHPTYWGHPYYGRHYYDYYYYRRPSIGVYNTWYVTNNYYTSNYRYRDGDYWRPRARAGSRPDEPRVRNYYYPPNTTDPTGHGRDNMNFSNRDRLQVSRDGRIDLNLRERRGTPTRGSTSDGYRAGGNQRTISNNRTATRQDGAVGSRQTGNARNRESAAAGNRTSTRTTNRSSTSRPEIRFRDRSNDAGASGSNRTTRPSSASSNRTGTNRQSINAPTRTNNASSRRPSTNATSNRSSGGAGSSVRRETPAIRQSAPSIRQNSPSSRTTRPTTRQSAPSSNRTSRATSPTIRQSAPSSRSSRPSTPTIRQSAPTSRSSRPSTPTIRQSAPSSSRASRPSAPSVRQSAPSSRPSVSSSRPSSSASSGSRSSSRSSSGRRSSSPRVRNQD